MFDHNAEKKKTLTPIDHIDHCCKYQCFKAQHNLLQLQHLRNQYWSFTKDTTRKQWFKELLLAAVDDNSDPDYKQFAINDIPVCYNVVKTLFGCSNNLLIGIDGSDTSEWGIPYPAVKTHESQKGKKLQCKVYGS